MADMDLGNLFIHLKADDTGVAKAFNNWVKGIEEVGKASLGLSDALKTVNDSLDKNKKQVGLLSEIFKQTASFICGTIKSISNSYESVSSTISKVTETVSKSAGFFFWPLKEGIKIIASVKTAVDVLGISSVKAAGELDLLYRELSVIVKDSAKLREVWSSGLELSGFFKPEQIMDAQISMQRVGITGRDAMETIRDAAVLLNEGVDEVATSIVRMSAGTMRGLRLMGVDFLVEGNKYMFQYRDQFGQTIESIVYGVQAAQREVITILKNIAGGAYAETQNTVPVLMKRIHTAFDLLRIEFGKGLLPVFEKLGVDVLKQIEELMPLAKELGEKLEPMFERIRQHLMDAAAYVKDLIINVAGAVENQGIGFVILNSLGAGAKLLFTAITSAVSATWSIWVAIFKMATNIFLEGMSKIKFFGYLGAGVRKERIEIALEGLDIETLKKLATNMGIDLNERRGPKVDNPWWVADSGYSQALLHSYGTPIGQSKELLIEEISNLKKGLSQEDLTAFFKEQGQKIGVAINVGYGTELAKAIEEMTKTLGEKWKAFGEKVKETISEYNLKMWQAAHPQKEVTEDFVKSTLDVFEQIQNPFGFVKKKITKQEQLGPTIEAAKLLKPPPEVFKPFNEGIEAENTMDNLIRDLKLKNSLEMLSTRQQQEQQTIMASFPSLARFYNLKLDERLQILEEGSDYYKSLENNTIDIDISGKFLDPSQVTETTQLMDKESQKYKNLVLYEKQMYDAGLKRFRVIRDQTKELDRQQRSYKQVQVAVTNWADNATNVWKGVGEVAVSALDGITDGITAMLSEGTFSFREFARMMLIELERVIVRAMIAQVLLAAIGAINGPSAGASGAANGGAGAGSGSAGSAGGMGVHNMVNAKGNAFNSGNVIPFASGGVLFGYGTQYFEETNRRNNALFGYGSKLMGSRNNWLGGLAGSFRFATGGIVNQPTLFPMANGTGLMGEAGPEAIMPLTRDSSGRLGVRSEVQAAPTVNNIKIVNVQSQAEILAAMSGPAGEKKIINVLKRNKGLVAGLLR